MKCTTSCAIVASNIWASNGTSPAGDAWLGCVGIAGCYGAVNGRRSSEGARRGMLDRFDSAPPAAESPRAVRTHLLAIERAAALAQVAVDGRAAQPSAEASSVAC